MARVNTYFGLSVVSYALIGAVVLGISAAMDSRLSGVDSADMSAAAVVKRIAPIAQLNTGAPAAAVAVKVATSSSESAAPRSGDAVFTAVCSSCHATGAAGAPKIGDKAAWGPRIKQGIDTLLSHAENGFQGKSGFMPPRGTCPDCSNAELKNAIEYMVSKAK